MQSGLLPRPGPNRQVFLERKSPQPNQFHPVPPIHQSKQEIKHPTNQPNNFKQQLWSSSLVTQQPSPSPFSPPNLQCFAAPPYPIGSQRHSGFVKSCHGESDRSTKHEWLFVLGRAGHDFLPTTFFLRSCCTLSPYHHCVFLVPNPCCFKKSSFTADWKMTPKAISPSFFSQVATLEVMGEVMTLTLEYQKPCARIACILLLFLNISFSVPDAVNCRSRLKNLTPLHTWRVALQKILKRHASNFKGEQKKERQDAKISSKKHLHLSS